MLAFMNINLLPKQDFSFPLYNSFSAYLCYTSRIHSPFNAVLGVHFIHISLALKYWKDIVYHLL